MVNVERIHRLDNGGQLKAFVDIQYYDLTIKGLRVVEGKKGLFVSMPSEIGKDGKWFSIVLPNTQETKDAIESAILKAYNLKNE